MQADGYNEAAAAIEDGDDYRCQDSYGGRMIRENDEILFDAATEHIRIGPCILHWSQAAKLELGVLNALHIEIQTRFRMPVSFERLLCDCLDDGSVTQSRSWSHCVEGIAHCVAAFQAATDATEHSKCKALGLMRLKEIAAKLCSYATALTQMTSPYLRDHFFTLLYEYVRNQTYDLAVKNILNRACAYPGDPCWSWVGAGRQRSECLNLIQMSAKALSDYAQALRDEMASLRLA